MLIDTLTIKPSAVTGDFCFFQIAPSSASGETRHPDCFLMPPARTTPQAFST
ncbi:MAG: hypothetical protein ACRC2J_15565 [Microcoleaceae cyanobacterium]